MALVLFIFAWADAAQSAPTPPEGARALVVHYANGRTAYQVVRPAGGKSWTPLFPRLANAETARDGLPLTALEIAYLLNDRNVIVTVSLLYGTPHHLRDVDRQRGRGSFGAGRQ